MGVFGPINFDVTGFPLKRVGLVDRNKRLDPELVGCLRVDKQGPGSTHLLHPGGPGERPERGHFDPFPPPMLNGRCPFS
jgi:hypothetical protein